LIFELCRNIRKHVKATILKHVISRHHLILSACLRPFTAMPNRGNHTFTSCINKTANTFRSLDHMPRSTTSVFNDMFQTFRSILNHIPTPATCMLNHMLHTPRSILNHIPTLATCFLNHMLQTPCSISHHFTRPAHGSFGYIFVTPTGATWIPKPSPSTFFYSTGVTNSSPLCSLSNPVAFFLLTVLTAVFSGVPSFARTFLLAVLSTVSSGVPGSA